jgi:hypothetical protein
VRLRISGAGEGAGAGDERRPCHVAGHGLSGNGAARLALEQLTAHLPQTDLLVRQSHPSPERISALITRSPLSAR